MGHGICYTETGVSDELRGEEMRRKIPADRAGYLKFDVGLGAASVVVP